MSTLPRAVRERLIALCAVASLALVALLCGCGGGGHPAVPVPSGADDVQTAVQTPNYLGDLPVRYAWTGPIIRYKFTAPAAATDIRGNSVPALPLTEERKDAARAAVRLWQIALSLNPASGQRVFVEVSENEAADVEIIVLPKASFASNVYGVTQVWAPVAEPGTIHRAVVRLREDLDAALFAYVVLHELGHALMSTDHSQDDGTVMFATVPRKTPRAVLTAKDANTVRAVYNQGASRAVGSPAPARSDHLETEK